MGRDNDEEDNDNVDGGDKTRDNVTSQSGDTVEETENSLLITGESIIGLKKPPGLFIFTTNFMELS